MKLWDIIDPAGPMSLHLYRRLTLIALAGVVLFAFHELWLPDNLVLKAIGAGLFMAGYGLFWNITLRRLRDAGQSPLFGLCFVFGGAIIPIGIGCIYDTAEGAEPSLIG